MGISLTAFKRTDTVKRYKYIYRTRRKRDAPMPRARDSTQLQHHFFQFVFFIYIHFLKKLFRNTLDEWEEMIHINIYR